MREEIAKLLASREKAWDLFDLSDRLGVSVTDAEEALKQLVKEGRAALTKKGRYTTPERMGLIPAHASALRSGAPIARPLNGGGDMRLSRRGELRALPDDLILVRVERANDGELGKCELAAVIERAHPTLNAVVRVERVKPAPEKRQKKDRKRQEPARSVRVVTAEPLNRRITCDIRLDGDLMDARSGDLVSLKVVEWPERDRPLVAEIREVVGRASDVKAQLRALAAEHGFEQEFQPDTVKEAQRMPDSVSEADRVGRADLRALVTFTIDGDDAQDFDDAISLLRDGDNWALGVHIADVSHYVREGSAIDREALSRGTSAYLPGLTLPMLPEALSNRLCSLMPDVDRLAMSLVMKVRKGKVVDFQLSPSVIHSSARLTYNRVNQFFAGDQGAVPEALHDTLSEMLKLSRVLRDKRSERGSIDFDLAEAAFTLDEDGQPTDVRMRERGESERMIEDFMLLANESVARLAKDNELPFIYRVHLKPDPDRLAALDVFLTGLNIKSRVGRDPHPNQLKKILDDTRSLPEAEVIKQVMLRSLKRAAYSDKPEGHFGLAAEDYCHFTSPIRRYPDLTVHRMLKRLIAGQPCAAYEDRMGELAKQCSASEYAATILEREADDLIKAHYMAGRVGRMYDGVVSGVVAWGFYVTLNNTVEGLVHIRTLDDDYVLDAAGYRLIGAMRKHVIRLGDAVRVRVDQVDVQAREIDFVLTGPAKGRKA